MYQIILPDVGVMMTKGKDIYFIFFLQIHCKEHEKIYFKKSRYYFNFRF